MIGVYKIICTQENIVYIGSSNNISRRWAEHKRSLNSNNHKNVKLQVDWNAYGDESFHFSVLEETNNIIQREQHYLDQVYPDCYNCSPNAWNAMSNPAVVKKQIESLRKSGKRGRQKLTEGQVIEIKILFRDSNKTNTEIAKQYNMSISLIGYIRLGKRWNHIKIEGFTEGKTKTAKDYEKEIIRLYIEGYKTKYIINKFKLKSTGSVFDVLKRNNIKTTRIK